MGLSLETRDLDIAAVFYAESGDVLGPGIPVKATLEPDGPNGFVIRLWFDLFNVTGHTIRGQELTIHIAETTRHKRIDRVVVGPQDRLNVFYDLNCHYDTEDDDGV